MAVGQKTNNRHCYLSIVDGAVVQKTADGGRKCYSFVEGKIDAIYTRRYTFDGEPVERWCIDMHDYTESYTLSFSLSSGPFISIVLALANDEALTRNTLVRIAPYTSKKGYTKVRVFTHGSDKKLMWVKDDIPPKKKTIQNGWVVVDDSERTAFVAKYVRLLCERISIRARSALKSFFGSSAVQSETATIYAGM